MLPPRMVLVVCALLLSTAANGHHSYLEFDDKTTIEVEGTLVAALWQNPHARLTVRASDGTEWDIETSPVNGLRRAGAPLELFAVGSTVRVAGWPSRRAASRLYGTNILSEDEQELILFRAEPRWNATAFGTERAAPVASAAPAAKTFFRVWGSFYARPGVADDPDASPAALSRVPLPLTAAAREAAAKFDSVEYNMNMGCTPKGMPGIMNVPTPLEFVDRGDSIVLRVEEFDSERVIHMRGDADPSTQPKTRLGYSVGRWEGETLVVETRRVGMDYLRPGVPMGPDASFVERFTLDEEGTRLHYSVVMTDPYSLTQPVEQRRSWIASSDEVLPYDCTPSGR